MPRASLMSMRIIESRAVFEGEEFEVSVHITSRGVRVKSGDHGSIFLSRADDIRVSAEMTARGRAERSCRKGNLAQGRP